MHVQQVLPTDRQSAGVVLGFEVGAFDPSKGEDLENWMISSNFPRLLSSIDIEFNLGQRGKFFIILRRCDTA